MGTHFGAPPLNICRRALLDATTEAQSFLPSSVDREISMYDPLPPKGKTIYTGRLWDPHTQREHKSSKPARNKDGKDGSANSNLQAVLASMGIDPTQFENMNVAAQFLYTLLPGFDAEASVTQNEDGDENL